jgi:hypothetical protein
MKNGFFPSMVEDISYEEVKIGLMTVATTIILGEMRGIFFAYEDI